MPDHNDKLISAASRYMEEANKCRAEGAKLKGRMKTIVLSMADHYEALAKLAQEAASLPDGNNAESV